jgi:hypothetical protein
LVHEGWEEGVGNGEGEGVARGFGERLGGRVLGKDKRMVKESGWGERWPTH